MEDQCRLEPRSADWQFNVLQITDTHLFAKPNGDLLGVKTAHSFAAVLDEVLKQKINFDFVLMTGDISQDYSVESYQRFANMVKCLNKPVFFLPGNHDDGPLMYRIFNDLGINTSRNIICVNWQFILLNSEVYGVAHGWVQRDQLEYAERCIREQPNLNTVICIHHLPLLVGSNWLDTQTLHNQDEFHVFVKSFPSIKAVISGHVHQEIDEIRQGIRYIATPSTSIQFVPHSHDFALDNKGPGWRYLIFKDNGNFETLVCRLETNSFHPRTDVGGY